MLAAVLALGHGHASANGRGGAIHPVPDGSANAIFYFNQRFIPEVAQSYAIESPMTVSAMSFMPSAITWVEARYFSTPESDRHSLEMFKTTYPPITADATVTVWRSDIGDPGPRFDTNSGAFTRVAQRTTSFDITIGQPRFITFDPPLSLTPGTYVFVLGMRFADPNILTMHIGGRESGDSQMAGPLADRPSSCSYTRSSDSYPLGRAYRGTGGSTPYTGAWDNYVGFGTSFVEHKAKVQQCIVVGKFDDIFNSGDLAMSLYSPTASMGAGSEAGQAAAAAPAANPVTYPKKPPRITRLTGAKGGLQATVRPSAETRRLPQLVVAFATSSGNDEVGRCQVPVGRTTCTIRGLSRKTTVYVTAGAVWEGMAAALGPNRRPVRTR